MNTFDNESVRRISAAVRHVEGVLAEGDFRPVDPVAPKVVAALKITAIAAGATPTQAQVVTYDAAGDSWLVVSSAVEILGESLTVDEIVHGMLIGYRASSKKAVYLASTGVAALDSVYLPLVTKVCLSGLPDTVVPDGDYGYPFDADTSGSDETTSDTQSGASITVERRVVTLPGDTPLGPPVCILDPDDCCTAEPDPPVYPPGDDPSTITVDCCPINPVPSILYATFDKLSGGTEWNCIDGAVLQLTHVGGGVWQGVNLDCPAMDDPDCIIPIDLRLSCVGTSWSLLPINMNYTAASDLSAVCNPFEVSRDFNFAATANIWPAGCDSPGFGPATFRITVGPSAP